MSKKLRVLIVTDYFHPHWTGLSRSILNFTKLLKTSADFTVLTVRYSKDLAEKEVQPGLSILRVPSLFRLSRLCYSPFVISRFLREILRHDVAFINSPCSNILPCSIIAKFFGKRLVIFHQGDLVLRKGISNRFLEYIFRLCTKLSLRLATVASTYTRDYAVHSSILKNYLRKFTPLLLPVMMEPTILPRPKILNPIYALKKSGKVIFGFAGRFVHEKGFDILLQAIPEVIKDTPNAHFVFAGETKVAYEDFFGENTALLERVASHLTLLPLLSKSEMQEFYFNIDFIVIPSRSDCFNLVQAEAALHAKPIIVSDIPGARALVKETGFGEIAKAEDAGDLASKIIKASLSQRLYLRNYGKVERFLDTRKSLLQSLKILGVECPVKIFRFDDETQADPVPARVSVGSH